MEAAEARTGKRIPADYEASDLSPARFGARSALVHWFAEISSTMDAARELARQGCPHMSLVVAERQSEGRGRLARSWDSREGGLYFTLVTRPLLPPELAHLVLFTASVSLCCAIRGLYGVEAGLKWPNDVLSGGKKLSGMLSELSAEGGRISYLNMGIGVNVNNDPGSTVAGAVSLKNLLGRAVDRGELLSAFLDEMDAGLGRMGDGKVMARWRALAETPGRSVTVATVRETLSGEAIDVDEDGALLLLLADGSVTRVLHGDCFHEAPGGKP